MRKVRIFSWLYIGKNNLIFYNLIYVVFERSSLCLNFTNLSKSIEIFDYDQNCRDLEFNIF